MFPDRLSLLPYWTTEALWNPFGRFCISLICFATAFVLMLLSGERLIQWLRNKRWRKGAKLDETWTVREDTPDTHQVKQGTPSMGGIGIVGATLLAYIAWQTYANTVVTAIDLPQGWTRGYTGDYWLIPTLATFFLLHAFLGFADDRSKASGRGGLKARQKLVFQILISVLFVWYAFVFASEIVALANGKNPPVALPLLSGSLSLNLVIGGFLCLVLVATSNAVNLTDGIDGLASGLAVQCGLSFMFIGAVAVDGLWDNDLFWACLAGACAGFLVFNKHPAKVFMGDTGSLAIGAALGAAAILMHAVWLLPFIGFIFFVEAASVTFQVLWFKWTRKRTGEGKRLFRRAPLHHHFELGGWSEWRVVATFWGVNLVTSIIGLVLWHTGVLPRFP